MLNIHALIYSYYQFFRIQFLPKGFVTVYPLHLLQPVGHREGGDEQAEVGFTANPLILELGDTDFSNAFDVDQIAFDVLVFRQFLYDKQFLNVLPGGVDGMRDHLVESLGIFQCMVRHVLFPRKEDLVQQRLAVGDAILVLIFE